MLWVCGCPKKSEETIGYLGVGVTGGCEPGTELGSLGRAENILNC